MKHVLTFLSALLLAPLMAAHAAGAPEPENIVINCWNAGSALSRPVDGDTRPNAPRNEAQRHLGSSVEPEGQGAFFDRKHPEGPSFIVVSGDYRMRFCEKQSWTMRELFYKGKAVLIHSGFMQPVLNEKVPAGTDPFLGTGHRREAIDSVRLLVEGGSEAGAYSIAEGLSVKSGSSFIFEKKSRFVSDFSGLLYEHTARLRLTGDGLSETFEFKAGTGTLSNVNFLYPFMHIFPKTTRAWIAGESMGETARGEFLDDKSFTLKKDILWALVYDPLQTVGLAYVYPEIYRGHSGSSNKFWNRTHDNKLYFQIDPPRNAGEEFSYSVTLRAFAATTAEWEASGKQTVNSLTVTGQTQTKGSAPSSSLRDSK